MAATSVAVLSYVPAEPRVTVTEASDALLLVKVFEVTAAVYVPLLL